MKSSTRHRPHTALELKWEQGADTSHALKTRLDTHAASGKLWLAIRLPQLALHALGWLDAHIPSNALHAVSVRHGRRAEVLAVSCAARAAGVEPGMGVASAHCICPTLTVHTRDEELERAALQGLAMWSGSYTSKIVLKPSQGLLLEVGASLRLFRGLGPLLQRMRQDLTALGHHPVMAVAPTARGAWMLARCDDERPITLAARLVDRLAPLPVGCLTLSEKALQDLEALGVRTVGDCARLPRDGLNRRFGLELVVALDEAFARREEVLTPWQAPPQFERRLELPFATCDHAVLQVAAQKILKELVGFLRLNVLGVRAIEIHIGHLHHPATRFTLQLVTLTDNGEHLLALLSQRLQRIGLPADAVFFALRASAVEPLLLCTSDMYDDDDGKARQDAPQLLIERLLARFGHTQVYSFNPRIDPRPERTMGRCHWGDQRLNPALAQDPSIAHMPIWLLRTPRRLQCRQQQPWLRGPLLFEQGPQRIEGGWWDGADIARDYYRVRSVSGASYWVFYDVKQASGWYLHGVFA